MARMARIRASGGGGGVAEELTRLSNRSSSDAATLMAPAGNSRTAMFRRTLSLGGGGGGSAIVKHAPAAAAGDAAVAVDKEDPRPASSGAIRGSGLPSVPLAAAAVTAAVDSDGCAVLPAALLATPPPRMKGQHQPRWRRLTLSGAISTATVIVGGRCPHPPATAASAANLLPSPAPCLR